MRILLISENYPPETNASALRTSAHAKAWVEAGCDVTVVTSYPNFPEGVLFEGYRQKLFERRMIDGVEVVRVATFIFPNAGTARRVLDFLSYMLAATIASLFVKRPDVVVATSPQFFAAVAGWMISVLRWRPFVFELRDLWPDSIVAVGALREGFAIRTIRRVEMFLYRRAKLIVSVTHAFKDNLVGRGIPSEKVVVVRNGVDLSEFGPNEAPRLRDKLGLQGKVVVSYIGTMGMAHGIGVVLEAADLLKNTRPDIAFVLVGAGAERDELIASSNARGLDNVQFVARVSHAEILKYWRLSDITLILLKDEPIFRTVIPSKVFEALATGTPILYNVQGELHALLEPLFAARYVAAGCAEKLADAISDLASDLSARRNLSAAGLAAAPQFDRNKQALLMLDYLRRGAERSAF